MLPEVGEHESAARRAGRYGRAHRRAYLVDACPTRWCAPGPRRPTGRYALRPASCVSARSTARRAAADAERVEGGEDVYAGLAIVVEQRHDAGLGEIVETASGLMDAARRPACAGAKTSRGSSAATRTRSFRSSPGYRPCPRRGRAGGRSCQIDQRVSCCKSSGHKGRDCPDEVSSACGPSSEKIVSEMLGSVPSVRTSCAAAKALIARACSRNADSADWRGSCSR